VADSTGSGVHSLSNARVADRPLAGAGVLVTRPARQAGPLAQKIAALGGSPIIFPAIVILPPPDASPLAALHGRLHEFDVAIFVSANAAEFGVPASGRWPEGVAVYAPGPGSAEALAALGIAGVQVPATTFDSEGLLALPELTDVRGKRIVIFRGEGGRELLAATLRQRGARVDHVACYRRARPASAAGLAAAFRDQCIDVVTVTSSEGIDNLWSVLDAPARAAWQAVTTLAPHPRIVARARELGLAATATAGGDAGLLAGLLQWSASHLTRS
jgi:uroporphyrinogen-III synthase